MARLAGARKEEASRWLAGQHDGASSAAEATGTGPTDELDSNAATPQAETEAGAEPAAEGTKREGAGETGTEREEPKRQGADSPPVSSKRKEGHVPYQRFLDVTRERAELKRKVQELEAVLERQPKARRTEDAGEPDWLDQLLGREGGKKEAAKTQAEFDLESHPGFRAMRERLDLLQVERDKEVLRSELAAVREVHPDVPRGVLLHAVRMNPEVDLHRFAEEWVAYVDQVAESRARAKPAAKLGAGSGPPPVPRRTMGEKTRPEPDEPPRRPLPARARTADLMKRMKAGSLDMSWLRPR